MEAHEERFRNPIVKLVYDAIKSYLEFKTRISPPRVYYKLLEGKSPCYVALFKNGQLRAMYGAPEIKEVTLGVEIVTNSIGAAVKEPGKPPVTLTELEELEICVYVLEKPRECTRETLDPAEFGLIVEQGEKRGVMLPGWPGVASVDKQIEAAAKKGGIDVGAEFKLYKFRATRFDRKSMLT